MVKQIILSQAPNCIVSPYEAPELRSGLTTFFLFDWNNPQTCFTDEQTADWVVNELLKKKVQVRTVFFPIVDFSGQPLQQSYVVRVSTGYFNKVSDVEEFALALEEVLTNLNA